MSARGRRSFASPASRQFQADRKDRTGARSRRRAGAVGGAFLELLYQGGQPLVNFPDITLRGVSYREGQLDLVLEGGNPAVLDQFRQQLEQQPGIQAEMRTTQREGRMESKVTLKKMPS